MLGVVALLFLAVWRGQPSQTLFLVDILRCNYADHTFCNFCCLVAAACNCINECFDASCCRAISVNVNHLCLAVRMVYSVLENVGIMTMLFLECTFHIRFQYLFAYLPTDLSVTHWHWISRFLFHETSGKLKHEYMIGSSLRASRFRHRTERKP